MKTFKELLIEQFASNDRYEIETDNNEVEIWDTEMKTYTFFKFDDNGNIIEMW